MRGKAWIRFDTPTDLLFCHFDTRPGVLHTSGNTEYHQGERDPMSMQSTKVLNVSMPPDMYEEVTRVAREEQCTKSELIRANGSDQRKGGKKRT